MERIIHLLNYRPKELNTYKAATVLEKDPSIRQSTLLYIFKMLIKM